MHFFWNWVRAWGSYALSFKYPSVNSRKPLVCRICCWPIFRRSCVTCTCSGAPDIIFDVRNLSLRRPVVARSSVPGRFSSRGKCSSVGFSFRGVPGISSRITYVSAAFSCYGVRVVVTRRVLFGAYRSCSSGTVARLALLIISPCPAFTIIAVCFFHFPVVVCLLFIAYICLCWALHPSCACVRACFRGIFCNQDVIAGCPIWARTMFSAGLFVYFLFWVVHLPHTY